MLVFLILLRGRLRCLKITYCKVDNTSSKSNTFEHAKPNNEKDECCPSSSFRNHTGTWVLGVSSHATVTVESSRNRINIVDDVVHVKFARPSSPRQGRSERIAEVVHDEAENRNIIRRDNIAIENDSQSHTLRPFTDMIVGDDASATVGLADGYLKQQDGDTEEE